MPSYATQVVKCVTSMVYHDIFLRDVWLAPSLRDIWGDAYQSGSGFYEVSFHLVVSSERN